MLVWRQAKTTFYSLYLNYKIMKKNPNVRAGGQHALEKISMVMKLCLFLLSFLVYSVSAKSMAQNVKLSMEKKSESLV